MVNATAYVALIVVILVVVAWIARSRKQSGSRPGRFPSLGPGEIGNGREDGPAPGTDRGPRRAPDPAPASSRSGRFSCPDCLTPWDAGTEGCPACGLVYAEDTAVGTKLWPVKQLDGPPLVGSLVLVPRGVYFLCEAALVQHDRWEEAEVEAEMMEALAAAGLGGGIGVSSATAQRPKLLAPPPLLEHARRVCLDERVELQPESSFWRAKEIRAVLVEHPGILCVETYGGALYFRTPKVVRAKLEAVTERLWGLV